MSAKPLLPLALALVMGALAWRFVPWRSLRAETIDRHAEDVQKLLTDREQHPPPPPSNAGSSASDEARFLLDEEEARTLFAMPRESFVYDERVYYRYVPDSSLRIEWPEHPDGFFIRRTNAEGVREDAPELPDADFLVLVAGDSHTDGICNNDESFANRLEARLLERHPGRSVEVWNSGVHGYSFYNYLGALEKALPKDPDAFVVAFYGGNDFLDVVKTAHFFAGTAPPERDRAYWDKLRAASKLASNEIAMALNQIYYFKTFPEEIEVAMKAVAEVTDAIIARCKRNGTVPIFMHIPTGYDCEYPDPELVRALEALGLEAKDLGLYDELADRLLRRLASHGARTLDLRPLLEGKLDELYWSDMHINLEAHQRIAELLLPEVEATWLLE